MKIEILNDDTNLSLIDRLLKIRKIEDKNKFLSPTWGNSRYNPFLLENIEKASEKILNVMKNNERIVIFGDYDVDGITATYVVFYFLYKFLGYKNVSIRLPSRQDGYGIRKFHIDELKQKNVSLVITVDNGITAVEEVDYANKLGLDIIITDHHSPLEKLPNSYAIINPKTSSNYPFKELAGVGVAFKLITALSNKLKLSTTKKNKIINCFLPIVAIGTVADCVPLIDENRFLVKKGLEIINNPHKRPINISNIISYLNLKNIDSFHIGYIIGPRLNASGRIHKPDNAFQVLFQHKELCQLKYLNKIEGMNKERQLTQTDILVEVEKTIDKNKNILLAIGEFHEGVIGIVAGKLTEKYNKPSIVLSINKSKNEAVGSCRAPNYFSIIKMLDNIGKKGIFERYGGHLQAGGLTIKLDKIEIFKKELENYGKNISQDKLEKIILVDTFIGKEDLISDDIKKLDLLAPFGEQNPNPTFLIKDLQIKKIDLVGKEKNHIKVYANKDGVDLTLLKWSGLKLLEKLKDKKYIDCVVQYAKDDYNGGFYFKILEIL